MLSDAHLGQFSLGVLAAAGVLLAVLISMLVFLLNRIANDELVAIERVSTAASDMTAHWHPENVQANRIFAGVTSATEVRLSIVSLQAIAVFSQIPPWDEWRTRLEAVTIRVVGLVKHYGSTPNLNQQERQDKTFLDGFSRWMFRLDQAIQFAYTAVILPKRHAKWMSRSIKMAVVVVVVSIVTSLLALAQSGGDGTGDGWNIWIAFGLAIVMVLEVAFLWVFVHIIGSDNEKRIRAAAESGRKESGS